MKMVENKMNIRDLLPLSRTQGLKNQFQHETIVQKKLGENTKYIILGKSKIRNS